MRVILQVTWSNYPRPPPLLFKDFQINNIGGICNRIYERNHYPGPALGRFGFGGPFHQGDLSLAETAEVVWHYHQVRPGGREDG